MTQRVGPAIPPACGRDWRWRRAVLHEPIAAPRRTHAGIEPESARTGSAHRRDGRSGRTCLMWTQPAPRSGGLAIRSGMDHVHAMCRVSHGEPAGVMAPPSGCRRTRQTLAARRRQELSGRAPLRAQRPVAMVDCRRRPTSDLVDAWRRGLRLTRVRNRRRRDIEELTSRSGRARAMQREHRQSRRAWVIAHRPPALRKQRDLWMPLSIVGAVVLRVIIPAFLLLIIGRLKEATGEEDVSTFVGRA